MPSHNVFFSYLLFNEEHSHCIRIDSLNSRVTQLKDAIFEVNRQLKFKYMTSAHLQLYPWEVYQSATEESDLVNKKMNDLALLSEYFPDELPPEGPHIVVKFPLPLLCVLHGYPQVEPFHIEANYLVATSTSVKQQISETVKPHLQNYAAVDLELWKVSIPYSSNLNDIHGLCEFKEGKVSGQLSAIFTEPPRPDHIHLVIRVPATISPSSSNESNVIPGPCISSYWSPRRQTVRRLYHVLMEEGFIQVRGTPGSGKSTLLNLLHNYILKRSPSSLVFTKHSWPRVPDAEIGSENALKRRLKELDPEYPRTAGTTFLLFDEAQDSYRDELLWSKFFKGVSDGLYFQYRVVVFCSYGSPSTRPVSHDIGTPVTPHAAARISLQCSDQMGSIGLLLKRAEFEEVVDRYKHPLKLHPNLMDLIFDWTAGHAGAVTGILRVVSHQVNQKGSGTQCDSAPMTVEDFHAQNPTHNLVRNLCGGAFERGLPKDTELSTQPDVVDLFRSLLTGGLDVRNGDESEAIRKCHRHGWIYAYLTATKTTTYALPSPLHAVCLSWRLEPSKNMPYFTSLFDLAIEAISNFTPSQLKTPIRRVNPMPTDRPPEAQYQDEFYRSVYSVTFGGVYLSPEFASARRARVSGRIDFFIPAMKWGIELTREGSRLIEHDSRFNESGAYGAWLESGDMVDYILLDCRTSPPKKLFPSIQNLFHVVFQDDYRQVVVYDNKGELVEGPIALLEKHY